MKFEFGTGESKTTNTVEFDDVDTEKILYYTADGDTAESGAEDAYKVYGFECQITSVQMADTIAATLTYGKDDDDSDLTITQNYSASTYLDILATDANKETYGFSDVALALGKAIKNYGSYVQPMLSAANGNWTIANDANTLASAAGHMKMTAAGNEPETDVTNSVTDYAVSGVPSDYTGTNVSALKFSLLLESATTIRLYVTLDGASTMTAKIDGEDAEVTAATADTEADQNVGFTPSGTVFKVEIPGISAHKLATPHTVIITADGGTSITLTNLSALSYVNAVLSNSASTNEQKHAVNALYQYYAATKAYRKGTAGYPEHDSQQSEPASGD